MSRPTLPHRVSGRTERIVLFTVTVTVAVLSICLDWPSWLKWTIFLIAMTAATSVFTSAPAGDTGDGAELFTIPAGPKRRLLAVSCFLVLLLAIVTFLGAVATWIVPGLSGLDRVMFCLGSLGAAAGMVDLAGRIAARLGWIDPRKSGSRAGGASR